MVLVAAPSLSAAGRQGCDFFGVVLSLEKLVITVALVKPMRRNAITQR